MEESNPKTSKATITRCAKKLEASLMEITKGDQTLAGDVLVSLIERRTSSFGSYVRSCIERDSRKLAIDSAIVDNVRDFLQLHKVSGTKHEAEQHAVDAVLVAACFNRTVAANKLAQRLGFSRSDKMARSLDWAQTIRETPGLKFVPKERKIRSDSRRDPAIKYIQQYIQSDVYDKSGTTVDRFNLFVSSQYHRDFLVESQNRTIGKSTYHNLEKEILSKRYKKTKKQSKDGATIASSNDEKEQEQPNAQGRRSPSMQAVSEQLTKETAASSKGIVGFQNV